MESLLRLVELVLVSLQGVSIRGAMYANAGVSLTTSSSSPFGTCRSLADSFEAHGWVVRCPELLGVVLLVGSCCVDSGTRSSCVSFVVVSVRCVDSGTRSPMTCVLVNL